MIETIVLYGCCYEVKGKNGNSICDSSINSLYIAIGDWRLLAGEKRYCRVEWSL